METLAASAPPAGSERGASARTPLHVVVLVALITAGAAAARLYALGRRGLWLDESMSVYNAQHSLPSLIRVIEHREIYMALYYVLLHFWITLGNSEFLLRLPSVIFSVAAIPLTYAIGARLFGRATGLLAAALLAVNVFHIRYAQEARSYALTVFLAALASWILVRNLQTGDSGKVRPAKASWVAYGVVLALMVYSHLFALLIVAAHAAAILCLGPGRIPWRGLARSSAWFIGLLLPMAIATARIMRGTYPLNWDSDSGFSNVLDFFVLTAGNRGVLLLVLTALAIAVLAFTVARGSSSSADATAGSPAAELGGRWGGAFVLLWFFLPVAIALAAAVVFPPFVPRYLLPCLPGFVLCVAAGLTRLPPRSIGMTLAAAILVLSVAAIHTCYDLGGGLEDWREISANILDQSQPGDLIYFTPEYAQVPFEYYRARRVPPPAWPRAIGAVVDTPFTPAAQPPAATPSSSPAPPPKRVWVVHHHPNLFTLEARREFRARLDALRAKGWTLIHPYEYPMVVVVFLEAPPSGQVLPQDLHTLFAPGPAGSAAPPSESPTQP